jgi:protein SCO1
MRISMMTRPLACTLMAATLAVAPGCAPSTSRAPAGAAVASGASIAAAVSAADRYSVYDLDRSWRDQQGRSVHLASLRGRPQVVAMIYTHCTTTCPFTVAEMKRIERESPVNAGFVLVSLDPARDDPARLATFASERGLDATRWTLLDGSSDAVRELATVLGVRYRRLSPEELAHSNALTVLDASGVVSYQHAGLDAAEDVMKALAALQQ